MVASLFGRIFDSDGGASGEPFPVSMSGEPSEDRPGVAGLSDGGFVAAWTASGFPPEPSEEGIVAQRFDGEGNSIGGENLASQVVGGFQRLPTAAAVSGGKFVVVWQSKIPQCQSWEVYRRLFAADGAPLEPETQVNQITAGDQESPHVTPIATGFLIVWQSTDPLGKSRIIGRMFEETGEPDGAEFIVNTLDEPWLPICAQNPVASRRGGSGFVVAWEGCTLTDMYGHQDIFYQRFAPTGQKVF